jgi:thiol-disulfide isomerase/thioredoxin
MSRQILIILAVIAALAIPPFLRSRAGVAQAADANVSASSTQEQPVTAVMFYSNWCGACQILDPKIEAVKPDFAGHAVDFVKFDFSYALMRGKALKAQAAEKGVPNIYAKNKGRTGFMLLIDPASEKVLDVITIRDNKASIAAKLNKSLNRKPVASLENASAKS